MLVDPATGTIWRALEKRVNVYIAMSTVDKQWEKKLGKEFFKMFQAAHLQFKFISLDEIDGIDDALCYHGQNGLKSFGMAKYTLALEPNPYSRDLRENGLSVQKHMDHSYKLTYKRKERYVDYIFPKHSSHFRVDPTTLIASASIYGDSYFLATNFDPKMMQLKVPRRELTVIGDFMSYVTLPPYVQNGDLIISEDDKYVYDVEGVMTCNSRRAFCAQIAAAKGKQLAPLSIAGNFIAYPYSTKFHYVGLKDYNGTTIFESPDLSRAAICVETEKMGLLPSKFQGAAFWYNEFTGKAITPLEKYGTVHPVETFATKDGKTRHASIIPFYTTGVGKRRVYVFGSESLLKENMSLLIHLCLGNLATVIAIPEAVKPQQTFTTTTDFDVDEMGFLSGDNYNKSCRQLMIEWFEEAPQAKSLSEISARYPHVSRDEIHQILLQLPNACPLDGGGGQVVWSLSQDETFGDQLAEEGLAHYLQGTELKLDVVTGDLEFVDLEDSVVERQLQFLDRLGFEIALQIPLINLGKIRRLFRQKTTDRKSVV